MGIDTNKCTEKKNFSHRQMYMFIKHYQMDELSFMVCILFSCPVNIAMLNLNAYLFLIFIYAPTIYCFHKSMHGLV